MTRRRARQRRLAQSTSSVCCRILLQWGRVLSNMEIQGIGTRLLLMVHDVVHPALRAAPFRVR